MDIFNIGPNEDKVTSKDMKGFIPIRKIVVKFQVLHHNSIGRLEVRILICRD